MKSRIAVFLFVFVSIYIIFNRSSFRTNMYVWDSSSYYLYLPAIFVYHDLDKFDFYGKVNDKYRLTPGADIYSIYDMPTGRRLNKYAVGTALLETPFFFAAHAYCKLTHAYEADGYTIPYQLAGVLCGIFWVALGLLFLRGFLKKYFNDTITAITLLCTAFGTLVYCYTIFSPGMSHPFEFFLFSGVLYHTELYYSSQKRKHMYWLGVLLGMVIITRPADIVIAIVPLLWQVSNKESLMARCRLLGSQFKDLLISLGLFLLVSLIQMAYWKYATGQWIYYSYQGEGFRFSRPHIIDGLFGYQKGWFIYTPMAFIAIFGFFCMRREERKLIPVVLLSLAVFIYVVFSWKVWWYGGGFGSRALIDIQPVVAFLLAFVCRQVFYTWRFVVLKVIFPLVLAFFITLNMFQTFQYSKNVIHWVLMSKPYYWRVFGKLTVTEEDMKLLMSGEEYTKEVEEANEKD